VDKEVDIPLGEGGGWANGGGWKGVWGGEGRLLSWAGGGVTSCREALCWGREGRGVSGGGCGASRRVRRCHPM